MPVDSARMIDDNGMNAAYNAPKASPSGSKQSDASHPASQTSRPTDSLPSTQSCNLSPESRSSCTSTSNSTNLCNPLPHPSSLPLKTRTPLHRRLLSHLRQPLHLLNHSRPSSKPEMSSQLSACPTSLSASASTTLPIALLLLLTITSGILDATTFPSHHVFTSNQTGNTIFLVLAVVLPHLSHNPSASAAPGGESGGKEEGGLFVTTNVAVALSFFVLGAYLTGQLGHHFSCTSQGRARWFVLLCSILQTLLIFLAALLQYRNGVQLTSGSDLCVLGLLAFQSGSQVVLPRALAVGGEISTAMATAGLVDLVADRRLFAPVSLARVMGGKVRGRKGKKENGQEELRNEERGEFKAVGGNGNGGGGERVGEELRASRRERSGTTGRNRRFLFLLSLVIGAFVGAGVYRVWGSKEAVLFSAVLKGLGCMGWWFVPGEAGGDGEVEGELEEEGVSAKEGSEV